MVKNLFEPDIYEAGYDQWELELRNPQSDLFAKKSDFLILFLSSTRLILHRDAYDVAVFCKSLKELLKNYLSICGGQVVFLGAEPLEESIDQSSVFSTDATMLRLLSV